MFTWFIATGKEPMGNLDGNDDDDHKCYAGQDLSGHLYESNHN